MENENNDVKRPRKARASRGSRSQTMFNFRLDNDLVEWIHLQHNMSWYLNDLIRKDREEILMGRK